MASLLANLVERWSEVSGVPLGLRPAPDRLVRGFPGDSRCLRSGVEPGRLASWEDRFGFALPESLKAWLLLSDGFYGESGPLVHPLSAIGPMVPFARIPGLVVQPESWFELGNPNWETVCIDLAYRWPGVSGDAPLFTSGDEGRGSPPRIIAPGFSDWFLKLLHLGGSEYWFEAGFKGLGDPWLEHRRRVSPPAISDRLRRLGPRVGPMLARGIDDRSIANGLGLTRFEVETIARHWQHDPGDFLEVSAVRSPPQSG